MDYTSYFRLIQTALTHCNEFVKKFDRITHYFGNEIYINECAFRLKNILLSNGFTNEDSHELRKITLFLMLNTDVKLKFDLSEDFNICHLVNNFPQLSKCLFLNLMWQLKLEKYYYEAVSFSPSWFIVEFLDETVDSMRFSKSFDVICQVKDLVEAIYTNTCRIDYRASKSEFNDKKLILERFIQSISSCLRHYNTPVTEESITKSKTKMKNYNGFSLNYQLSMVLCCFKMFLKKPCFEIEEKYHIYKICTEKEPELNNYSVNKYSSAVFETLTEINVLLLNTLQNSLLTVTCDDFMYWVEVDIDDNTTDDEDLKRDNLQKSIGEQAYELIEIINNCPELSDHNVKIQLSSISLKPETVADIAREASMGTVLQKIETSKSRVVWLEELLNRKDNIYFNSECLQTIKDNADLIKFDHLIKILRDHQEFDMMDDDENQINEIFLNCGSKLGIDEVQEFVEHLINNFGKDYCITSETGLVQEQDITNYLNKITEENIEEIIMWKLILRNPRKFYEKLLEDIDNQDESQISTVLKVIASTSRISNNFIKNIITSNHDEVDTNENSSRHIFLAGIFKLQIIDRKEFVKDILMIKFSQALPNNASVTDILTELKTLKSLTSHLKLTDLLPPLMIQLAQLLDKYRWDLMSYSSSKEEIVDITITIIQDLMKIILKNGTKNDKQWIKSKIEHLKLMTKFYFQRLSLEKGENIIEFDQFLNPDGFSNFPKLKITSFLCENIVRCTLKELQKLMNNEILLNFYTEALSLLSTIVKKSNEDIPLACLRKCVTDYVKILSDILIPSAQLKNQMEALLKDVVNLLKKLPPVLHSDLTILFLDSIEKMKSCENYSSLVSEINDCELKRILLE